MEVFYLFSVRYLKAPSFSWQGVRGTPRVLAAVAGVFALQLLFTYAPPMRQLFQTEALPLHWGLRIVAVGILLLVVLECEKAVLVPHRRARMSCINPCTEAAAASRPEGEPGAPQALQPDDTTPNRRRRCPTPPFHSGS
ncbi:MAG: cation transporting ATPase C-terminal domain-containing protein [Comamonadaceae bacterium]|nr:cation transporting ATPase C-terminal domain-containing protein [Comamonadaceae bacterium]